MRSSHRPKGSLVALVLVGASVVASGCSSKSKSAQPRDTTAVVHAPTTTQPPPEQDVKVTRCADSLDPNLGPSASVTITNHTSKVEDYLVTIDFDPEGGGPSLDTSFTNTSQVRPGKSVATIASSVRSQLRGQKFVCKVTDVARSESTH